MVKILSLGGSIVAPDGVDTEFLKKFKALVEDYLAKDSNRKLILVIGGGAPARVYQKAFREIKADAPSDVQDWIGITATRLNAQLVKSIFGDLCKDPVVTDPSADIKFTGRILVGRDCRVSSDEIRNALVEGITDAGADVYAVWP